MSISDDWFVIAITDVNFSRLFFDLSPLPWASLALSTLSMPSMRTAPAMLVMAMASCELRAERVRWVTLPPPPVLHSQPQSSPQLHLV